MTYLVIPSRVSIHDAEVIAECQTLQAAHDFIYAAGLKRVQLCATENGRRRFLSAAEQLERHRMHATTRED